LLTDSTLPIGLSSPVVTASPGLPQCAAERMNGWPPRSCTANPLLQARPNCPRNSSAPAQCGGESASRENVGAGCCSNTVTAPVRTACCRCGSPPASAARGPAARWTPTRMPLPSASAAMLITRSPLPVKASDAMEATCASSSALAYLAGTTVTCSRSVRTAAIVRVSAAVG